MACAALFLPFLPLLAKQILLNNFLSDIPALAIATDSGDQELSKSQACTRSASAIARASLGSPLPHFLPHPALCEPLVALSTCRSSRLARLSWPLRFDVGDQIRNFGACQ